MHQIHAVLLRKFNLLFERLDTCKVMRRTDRFAVAFSFLARLRWPLACAVRKVEDRVLQSVS
jgi:hypothetical protein